MSSYSIANEMVKTNKLLNRIAEALEKLVELEANPAVVVNNFDGGLVGDPKRQAKAVLDVLNKNNPEGS